MFTFQIFFAMVIVAVITAAIVKIQDNSFRAIAVIIIASLILDIWNKSV